MGGGGGGGGGVVGLVWLGWPGWDGPARSQLRAHPPAAASPPARSCEHTRSQLLALGRKSHYLVPIRKIHYLALIRPSLRFIRGKWCEATRSQLRTYALAAASPSARSCEPTRSQLRAHPLAAANPPARSCEPTRSHLLGCLAGLAGLAGPGWPGWLGLGSWGWGWLAGSRASRGGLVGWLAGWLPRWVAGSPQPLLVLNTCARAHVPAHPCIRNRFQTHYWLCAEPSRPSTSSCSQR